MALGRKHPFVGIDLPAELVKLGALLSQAPGGPSYTVFRIGDTYYMKNELTGVIESDDLDAVTIIQKAINVGNYVFVRDGTYDIKSPLSIAKDFFMLELSPQAIFKSKLGAGEDMLRITGLHHHIIVKGGRWIGNGAERNGIYITDNCWRIALLDIQECLGFGNYDLRIDFANTILVKNCHFNSIDLTKRTTLERVVWAHFLDCGFIRDKTTTKPGVLSDMVSYAIFENCIFMTQGGAGAELIASVVTFINCLFEDNAGAGLVNTSSHIVLLNCQIYTNDSRGIYMATSPATLYVLGNTSIRDNAIQDLTCDTGARALILDYDADIGTLGGLGYLTKFISKCPAFLGENSGVATFTAGVTSVTISHGLAITPKIVLVTPHHSEIADIRVIAKTATDFTVEVTTAPTADRTFDWYAEV